MNKKTKNIIIYSLAGLIVLLALVYKFLPAKIIIGIAGQDNPVSEVLCTMPVKISGDSMAPFLENGKRVEFSKCFQPEDIDENSVIMFKDGDINRLAVVSKVENGNIKLFQPNRRDRVINDITSEDIVAIYKEKYKK